MNGSKSFKNPCLFWIKAIQIKILLLCSAFFIYKFQIVFKYIDYL